MDSLCLKAGIQGIATPIAAVGAAGLDFRISHTSHITSSAVGRPSAALSVDKPSSRNSPWSFSFRHPLRSLWPGSRNRFDAVAVDGPVLVDDKEDKKDAEQNGNWVMKILRVRSLRTEEDEAIADGFDGSEAKTEDRIGVSEENDCAHIGTCIGADADHDCDVCAVDDVDDNIEFDRDSFSKLLRRVSLAEARLYAQMAHLGSLAYSIAQIKVCLFIRFRI